MESSYVVPLCLGLALSACAGFRVFIPLLAAGLAAKAGLFEFSDSFAWMESWPAIISFGAAAVFEVLAYYIPFIDNLLDSIATPAAIIAGTLISVSVFPGNDEMVKWILGIVVGGGSAGIVQAGTGLLRLFSSKATAGTGNHVVASGENAAAIGGSALAAFLPVVAAIIVAALLIFIIRSLFKRRKQS